MVVKEIHEKLGEVFSLFNDKTLLQVTEAKKGNEQL